MNTIASKLEESKGMVVMVFVEGGQALEGRVIEVTSDAVTFELQANTERQAFSGGQDLKRITKINCTIKLESVIRLDQMATGKVS